MLPLRRLHEAVRLLLVGAPVRQRRHIIALHQAGVVVLDQLLLHLVQIIQTILRIRDPYGLALLPSSFLLLLEHQLLVLDLHFDSLDLLLESLELPLLLGCRQVLQSRGLNEIARSAGLPLECSLGLPRLRLGCLLRLAASLLLVLVQGIQRFELSRYL